MNASVNFDARDNGLLGYIDRLSQKAQQLNKENIKAALDGGNSTKEQLRQIEELIKKREKAAQIEVQAAQAAARAMKEQAAANASNPEFRKNIEDQRNAAAKDFRAGRITSEEYRNKISGLNAQISPALAESRARELERQAKDQYREVRAQTSLQREQIETLKQTAREEYRQDSANARAFVAAVEAQGDSASEEDRLKASIIRDEDSRNKKENSNGVTSFAGGYLAANIVQSFTGKMDELANSKNGFDLIKPASAGLGGAIGTGLGGIIGALLTKSPAGALTGGAIGNSIGGGIGGLFGGFDQRARIEQQEFAATLFSNRATTGKLITSAGSFSDVGLTRKDLIDLRTDFSKSAGRSMSEDQVGGAFSMQKGYGVSIETSKAMVESFRTGSQKDLKDTLGGVFERGLDGAFKRDRSFLNEFLSKNFTGLQKELAKTNFGVGTATTLDILNRFNRVGGLFSANNPNSMGAIMGIQGSLANPSSDVAKAISFQSLRMANPNASISELIEMRQQGLSNPHYMKNMMQMVEQMGGNEDMKVMNTAGLFGLEGNMQAARRLYKNKSAITSGRLSEGDLKGLMSDGEMRNGARENTTLLEENTARISDALVGGFTESVPQIIEAFNKALENQQITVVMDGNGASFKVNSNKGLMENKTKDSKGQYRDKKSPIQSRFQ